MSGRGKRMGPTVMLPWERRGLWFGVVGRRRVRALLAALVGCLLVLMAWKAAERRARVRTTRAGIAEVQRAVAAFRAEVGRCPRSAVELVHPPKAGAKYLDEIPSDGWGRELYVRCPAQHDPGAADVISAGPSGSFAHDDNIL
ncbi:MAG: type II secretion system protein GspG [Myxococcales bacterium]|nr:type II secretion system protein GspG [Myxococcales bacterium]